MRAFELYEANPTALGLYDPSLDQSGPSLTDTKISFITLRHLNKLKHIRRNRQREHDAKMATVSVMYGDPQIRENELEAQEQALKNLKDEIANQIDAAEIDQKQKSHIEDMAMDAVIRQRKK